jgi:hypothetical protein
MEMAPQGKGDRRMAPVGDGARDRQYHPFVGHRIALAAEVVRWLRGFEARRQAGS